MLYLMCFAGHYVLNILFKGHCKCSASALKVLFAYWYYHVRASRLPLSWLQKIPGLSRTPQHISRSLL